MELFKPIKNTKRYFIHRDGYVFKTEGFREIEIPINIIKGIPKVNIQNQKINLILLMLEYYGEIKGIDMQYSYKLKNNRLPIENIYVKYLTDFETNDERLIFQFKCQEKASAQNSRVKNEQKITSIDVLNCLKRTNFKCFYCGTKIKAKTWHLDHVQPISKSGLNTSNNITSSCKECNLMKGALDINKFLHQVKLINNNFISEVCI